MSYKLFSCMFFFLIIVPKVVFAWEFDLLYINKTKYSDTLRVEVHGDPNSAFACNNNNLILKPNQAVRLHCNKGKIVNRGLPKTYHGGGNIYMYNVTDHHHDHSSGAGIKVARFWWNTTHVPMNSDPVTYEMTLGQCTADVVCAGGTKAGKENISLGTFSILFR